MGAGRPLKNNERRTGMYFQLPESIVDRFTSQIAEGQRTDFIMNLLEVSLNPEVKNKDLQFFRLSMKEQIRLALELEVIKKRVPYEVWELAVKKITSEKGALKTLTFEAKNKRRLEIISMVEKLTTEDYLPTGLRQLLEPAKKNELE